MDPDFLCYAVKVSLVRIFFSGKLFASRMENATCTLFRSVFDCIAILSQ